MPQKLAIIAGVGPGTGRSLAVRFAAAYTVILLSRSPSNFAPIVDEINASSRPGGSDTGEAFGISTDLTDPASVQSAFRAIQQRYPGRELAAAVFNSGSMVRKPFLELTEDDFTGALRAQV
jgi:NAD(P)-dependent dehydrogenase (short-subunit alcohol dehydrogenase family)